MARILAVRWNGRSLRFACADADRGGRLRMIDSGLRLPTEPQSATAATDLLRQVVQETKCEKQRLLILIGRGAIESTTFDVPRATDDELPALVQNLALQNLPGLTEDSALDFIAYPARADGSRTVSAMAIMAEEQAQIRALRDLSGCRNTAVLAAPHALRAFAAVREAAGWSATAGTWDGQTPADTTLLVARGDEQADVLVSTSGLPLLSRTIRLPKGMPQPDAAQFLIGETQRTLISAGGHLAQRTRISRVVLIGAAEETQGLAQTFADHYSVQWSMFRGWIWSQTQGRMKPTPARILPTMLRCWRPSVSRRGESVRRSILRPRDVLSRRDRIAVAGWLRRPHCCCWCVA
ncbi:MAG: hypothetical protein ACKPJD_12330, partial [Planctomycetaceae bacterium]